MLSPDIINQSLYPNSTKDTIKYSMYPNTSTYEDIKHNNLLEEFSNLVNTIYNTRNKNIKDFVRVYQIAIDHTYKIDDPLLMRHFLLETIEEINNDLIKNNKPYRVSFGYNILNHFLNEDDAYYKKNKFYNDDGTLNDYKLSERIETLNKVVRSCSFSNNIFLTIKDMETDLPVLHLQKHFLIVHLCIHSNYLVY